MVCAEDSEEMLPRFLGMVNDDMCGGEAMTAGEAGQPRCCARLACGVGAVLTAWFNISPNHRSRERQMALVTRFHHVWTCVIPLRNAGYVIDNPAHSARLLSNYILDFYYMEN